MRPLREEEILQLLAVDPREKYFAKGKRFNADIRRACGPIIDIVHGTVRFVHFSAKQYDSGHTGFVYSTLIYWQVH